MAEICFRFTAGNIADGVLADLRWLHPFAAQAHSGEEPEVVHLPDALWARPFVPEIALGSGGRLSVCRPAPTDRCAVHSEVDAESSDWP